jgi:nitrogen fixation protein NifU and related proteins
MAEGDAELQDLYREVLLDYYRSAARRGRLEKPDIEAEGKNPLCGDEVRLTLRVSGGAITEVRHDGHGCVISRASTAMLAEALEGASLEQARELAEAFKAMMLGRRSFDDCPEELEPLKSLAGVAKFPVRVKCAILSWNTLLEGLKTPKGGKEAVFEER